jgi:hypothetical protein
MKKGTARKKRDSTKGEIESERRERERRGWRGKTGEI